MSAGAHSNPVAARCSSQPAAVGSRRMVAEVEPDRWRNLQRRVGSETMATVGARVAGSEAAGLAERPETTAGFAQAVFRLTIAACSASGPLRAITEALDGL